MRFLAFLFILAILVLGFGVAHLRRHRWKTSRKLIETYRKRFNDFRLEYRQNFNQQHYEWLMRNVLRVQATINELVASSRYEDYFQRDFGRSDRSLVEILEQMGQMEVHDHRISRVNNMMTRCLGIVDEEVERAAKRSRHPMILFREGIRSLLLVPSILGRWASGRSQLDRLLESDGPRTAGWVSTCSALGLLILIAAILVGWAPLANWTIYSVHQVSLLVTRLLGWLDWLSETVGKGS